MERGFGEHEYGQCAASVVAEGHAQSNFVQQEQEQEQNPQKSSLLYLFSSKFEKLSSVSEDVLCMSLLVFVMCLLAWCVFDLERKKQNTHRNKKMFPITCLSKQR